jgi:hypothetical protein
VQLQPASKPQEVAKRPSNRLRPFVAAKIIFYRVSNLPSGRLQMRASVQLQPATKPQEGWQSPASALYGRQSHFLSGFEPAARQASNASVQLQPATKPQ